MCPFIENNAHNTIKNGFYAKKHGRQRRIQRYFCKQCNRYFSEQTGKFTYRERKPHINNSVFRLLGSGVSQRRTADILGIHRKTVERKMLRAAKLIEKKYLMKSPCKNKVDSIIFDEMETHEHSKLKPVSISVAVEEKSRKILSLHTAQMPAKGLLARASVKKYGRRKDFRPVAMEKMMIDCKRVSVQFPNLKSDKNPRYPRFVRKHYSTNFYQTFKGRRGCIVGLGELKRGGWDPLFPLNHTCAMIRDNLKCLARRTWCTSKLINRLQGRLWIYMSFHNQRLDGIRSPVLIS